TRSASMWSVLPPGDPFADPTRGIPDSGLQARAQGGDRSPGVGVTDGTPQDQLVRRQVSVLHARQQGGCVYRGAGSLEDVKEPRGGVVSDPEDDAFGTEVVEEAAVITGDLTE